MAIAVVKNLSNHPLIRYLQWDSDFFGLHVASLEGGHLQAKTSKVIFDWCRKEKISCLYFLADGTDSQTLEYACNFGFKFVDVRVEMEYDLSNVLKTEILSLEIKPVTQKEQLNDIQVLARKSHTDSRFFKDLNFSVFNFELLFFKSNI